jgi:hypothetical protein
MMIIIIIIITYHVDGLIYGKRGGRERQTDRQTAKGHGTASN